LTKTTEHQENSK